MEWITIAALVLGPILALLTQRLLDAIREHRNTQKKLYFQLMSTRGLFNSQQHVEALNSIDVIFSDSHDIRDSWKRLLDHLSTIPHAENWQDRLTDLRVDLYRLMGLKLGYDYTTDYLKRGIYFPTYHQNYYQNQDAINQGLADALKNGVLKVTLIEPAAP